VQRRAEEELREYLSNCLTETYNDFTHTSDNGVDRSDDDAGRTILVHHIVTAKQLIDFARYDAEFGPASVLYFNEQYFTKIDNDVRSYYSLEIDRKQSPNHIAEWVGHPF